MKKFVLFILVSLMLSIASAVDEFPDNVKKDKVSKKESKFKGMFRDSVDNKFDVSKWVSELHGFLPLPSIITESVYVYEGMLNMGIFHPTKQSVDKNSTGERQLSSRSLSLAGGGGFTKLIVRWFYMFIDTTVSPEGWAYCIIVGRRRLGN